MFKKLLFIFISFELIISCKEEITMIETEDVKTQNDSIHINTGLPVIEIITDDGTDVMDKETWKSGVLKLYKDEDTSVISDSIKIKGRGNVSFQFPKKSFTLKFDNKQSVLGMRKHKRWVFQANYHDRTLLRNALTFHISHIADKMEWNPQAEFAEVIYNGKHIGNYLICEQIKVDKNRVPIDEKCLADEDCGFIFEYDSYFDENLRFLSSIYNFPVCISYPDEEDCNGEQINYAKNFIKKIEELTVSKDFDKLFAKYIDIDSFVDYWIVLTITGNTEPSVPRSVYFYKKPGGKLFAGPLWDFDYSTFTAETGTSNTDILYYTMLFKSDVFRSKIKSRWKELSVMIRKEANSFIIQNKHYLYESAVVNEKIWPIVFPYSNKCKNGDEDLPFQDSVDALTDMFNARMDFVDGLIQAL